MTISVQSRHSDIKPTICEFLPVLTDDFALLRHVIVQIRNKLQIAHTICQGCGRGLFSRDRGMNETLKPETEALTIQSEAFRARDWDEAEAYQLRGETEPRHYCASREALLCLETASRPRRQDRGHIPCPHHSVLTSVFWANLGRPVAPSIAMTGRWGCCKVFRLVPHPVISTTMAKGFWRKVLTGRMLLATQQCQSTEGNVHI